MSVWKVVAVGGPHDGFSALALEGPRDLLIVWSCASSCDGHGTFDANHPAIVLRTAEPYRKVRVDAASHVATYEPAGNPPPVERSATGLAVGGPVTVPAPIRVGER